MRGMYGPRREPLQMFSSRRLRSRFRSSDGPDMGAFDGMTLDRFDIAPRHYFGGGRTVVQQVPVYTPAPAASGNSGGSSSTSSSPANVASSVSPPPRGEAAKNVGQLGLAAANRMKGRAGTILAPRGTLEDQVKSLLGG